MDRGGEGKRDLGNFQTQKDADWDGAKLQAAGLQHPSIVDYAIGLEKLSANGLFFVGAQMAAGL